MSEYTVEDLAQLKRSIALGALKVRYADGRETTFRSLDEMLRIRDEIEADLSGRPRGEFTVTVYQSR